MNLRRVAHPSGVAVANPQKSANGGQKSEAKAAKDQHQMPYGAGPNAQAQNKPTTRASAAYHQQKKVANGTPFDQRMARQQQQAAAPHLAE